MSKERNLNGLVLVDKEKLGEMLDDFKRDAEQEEAEMIRREEKKSKALP